MHDLIRDLLKRHKTNDDYTIDRIFSVLGQYTIYDYTWYIVLAAPGF